MRVDKFTSRNISEKLSELLKKACF